ncbi:hypothetical protein EIP86_003764 [Pleurotus ostreatoroseus]|nr:hypothetical protein EIP86_003764 [Pleurotus ostreatoroseus]
MAPSRETIKIESLQQNVFLDVWLYKPDGPGPYPVVVAGHGMTLEKEAGLAVFGERWAAEAGFASLILDYRGFGSSDGQPRNLIVLEKQVQDFRSVIEWARARPETFRTDKIVVMGSALSGTVVADLVVHDGELAGYATLTALPANPRVLFWSTVDYLCGKLGLSPVFIKAVGKPNEFAFLNRPSCHQGFCAMYENGTSTKTFPEVDNVLAPRLAFEMMSWRPPLKDAKCPLLVVAGRNDDMIPMHVTQKVAHDAGEKICLEWYSGGHFDVLEGGSAYEFNMQAQLQFLRSLL